MFNWNEIWQHMGVPALVVAGVLLLMGVTSLTVFVERLLTLRRPRNSSPRFADRVGDGIVPSALPQVISEAQRTRPGIWRASWKPACRPTRRRCPTRRA